MSLNVKLFISFIIYRESRTYYKAFEDELNRHIKTDFSILLPVDQDGNPDWKYMENVLKTFKHRHNQKLILSKLYYYKIITQRTANY